MYTPEQFKAFLELLADNQVRMYNHEKGLSATARKLSLTIRDVEDMINTDESLQILDQSSPAKKRLKLSEILEALHNSALTGNPAAIKLELAYDHNFNETQKVEHSGEVHLDAAKVVELIEKKKAEKPVDPEASK